MRILVSAIASIALGIVFTSCDSGRSIFTNASMGSTNGYVAKPEYQGKKESALYVSGEFGNSNVSNRQNGTNRNPKYFGGLNLHRAHTAKNFNTYYGVGGQFGSFDFSRENFVNINSDINIPAGKQSYYAIHAKGGVNYLVSTPSIDFRVLGVDLGYIHEFGPYQETLKAIEAANAEFMGAIDDVDVFRKASSLYLGLNTEVLFKLNENNSIGVNPFVGNSFLESKKGLYPNVFGLNISYRYSDFTFSFLNEQTSQYHVSAFSCKLGISYKLN